MNQPISEDDAECSGGCEEHHLYCECEVRRLQSYIAHHDGDAYRQCSECGSLDFAFKFDNEGMHCDCDACDNEWKVKIE